MRLTLVKKRLFTIITIVSNGQHLKTILRPQGEYLSNSSNGTRHTQECDKVGWDRQLDSLVLSMESPSCCNNCACDEAGETCGLNENMVKE